MTGGIALAGGLSALALALGVAHHAGRFRWLAEVWVLSPYLVLAVGWMGAGGVLSAVGLVLADQDATVLVVLGVAAVLCGQLAWFVGVVGLVWLPRRLRPRWLVEQVARDPGLMRLPRRAGRRPPRRPGP